MVGPVYDVRRVDALLNLGYPEEQLAEEAGPTPEALSGFVTFFDPGFDIIDQRGFERNKVITVKEGRLFYAETWYDDEAFARLSEEPGYRQLRMEAVADSFGKSFAEQEQLLPDGEEVPPARQVLMGMAVHFLATGVRLFPRCYVRCKDLSHRFRVYVGYFGALGWRVNGYSDGLCNGRLGLASARKTS